MRVLVTGSSGFLLRNILPEKDWEIVIHKVGRTYKYVDMVLHFGSPTDVYDFENKGRMATSMVDLTAEVAHIAIENNAKLVYASSFGAEYLEDEYSIYKRAMEQYVSATVPNHLILRIPRVYGKDKVKGLMKRIRQNDINPNDWNETVEYIDIQDFKVWFDEVLSKDGVQYYDHKFRTNTIKELKEIY